MPRILSVIGARPQFVKAAVVSRAFASLGIDEEIVHTGQHYDDAMSGQFQAQLGMNNIAVNLSVGSGNHSHQTARIMTGLHDYLEGLSQLPEAIIVYGDTNSTVAAGLVAAKLHIPLVHVEAGLRSFNRAMPEEVNRVVTDHVSNLLFCSSQAGVRNLAAEGIVEGVHEVGDVMLDGFLTFREEARALKADFLESLGLVKNAFCLATIHRPSNTDDRDRLQAILSALGAISQTVLWPIHPRNKAMLSRLDIPANVQCVDPVGYLEMLLLLDACTAVFTDSGGLQKEAHWAQRRCITLRDETEWVETLEGGWNTLADPSRDSLAQLLERAPTSDWRMLYGDGKAATKIASRVASQFGLRRP